MSIAHGLKMRQNLYLRYTLKETKQKKIKNLFFISGIHFSPNESIQIYNFLKFW